MAGQPKLNPEILSYLQKKLNKTEATVRSNLSVLRRSHPTATLNAVAQLYAENNGLSVRRLLSKVDKATLPGPRPQSAAVVYVKRAPSASRPRRTLLEFETEDLLLKKHIEEINRAYEKECYTCVFVLSRKVFENLIIEILGNKFPIDVALYLDVGKARNLDFSVVLENLFKKRGAFDLKSAKAIERLHQLLKPFKSDANDKAHSLFHIVESRGEVDDWHLETIIDLFRRID